MGVISKIRRASPYFLIVFSVTFLVFMVISDIDPQTFTQSGGSGGRTEIGSVNGESIFYQDYEKRVTDRTESQRRSNPEAEIDDQKIRQEVWDEIVDEMLMRQEAKKLGIVVTDAEIADLVLDNPPDYLKNPFIDTVTKQFNRNDYLQFITDPDAYLQDRLPPEEIVKYKDFLLEVENFIYKDKVTRNVRNVVTNSSTIPSPLYIEHKYKVQNTAADVNYIAFDVANVSDNDVATPTDEEVQAYYEKYKLLYKQKPTRKIKYATFPIEASAMDSTSAEKKMKKIQESLDKATGTAKDSVFKFIVSEYGGTVNDFQAVKDVDPTKKDLLFSMPIGAIAGPLRSAAGVTWFSKDSVRTGVNDMVRYAQIFMAADKNKDSVRKAANEVYNKAKSGTDFASLASQYSQDQQTAQKGGDAGFATKAQLDTIISKPLFNTAVGAVAAPIEFPGGFLIVKVLDRVTEEVKYSEVTIPIRVSGATENQLRQAAKSFAVQLEEGVNIDSLGAKLGKNVVETTPFEKSLPVLGSKEMTDFAFEGKTGTVIQPLELKNYGIVVAQVVDAREVGTKPVEDVRDEISEQLRRIKKLDKLKVQAQETATKLTEMKADILARVAEFNPELKVSIMPKVKDDGNLSGFGSEPAFTATAMKAEIGKIIGPIRGEKGYFIIQVVNRQEADLTAIKKDYQGTVKSILDPSAAQFYQAWYNTAKERATIVDKRGKF